MTITLNPELDRFLESEVAAGRYASVSDAVNDAVEHLRQDRETAELKRSLAEVRASLNRGEGAILRTDEERKQFFDELEQRGRARLEAERHTP